MEKHIFAHLAKLGSECPIRFFENNGLVMTHNTQKDAIFPLKKKTAYLALAFIEELSLVQGYNNLKELRSSPWMKNIIIFLFEL